MPTQDMAGAGAAARGLAPLMSSVKQDWQTPENVLELVRAFGPIALDPATTADNPTGARRFFTPETDGLNQSWLIAAGGGLTYVNPPYGRALAKWAHFIGLEGAFGAEIIALVPARTDTKWFQGHMVPAAAAICFWKGRLTFKGAEDPAPFPSALVYYGARVDRFRDVFGTRGWIP